MSAKGKLTDVQTDKSSNFAETINPSNFGPGEALTLDLRAELDHGEPGRLAFDLNSHSQNILNLKMKSFERNLGQNLKAASHPNIVQETERTVSCEEIHKQNLLKRVISASSGIS